MIFTNFIWGNAFEINPFLSIGYKGYRKPNFEIQISGDGTLVQCEARGAMPLLKGTRARHARSTDSKRVIGVSIGKDGPDWAVI